MRGPGVDPALAKQVLTKAGVRDISKRINVDPKFLRAMDNHTTVYIVAFQHERHLPWLQQCHDLLRTTSACIYWFHPDAVLWSTKPYIPRT